MQLLSPYKTSPLGHDSRLAVEESGRLLRFFGADTRILDPIDLPLPDQVTGDDHPASMSFASTPFGRKAWSGAVPSGTARSAVS